MVTRMAEVIQGGLLGHVWSEAGQGGLLGAQPLESHQAHPSPQVGLLLWGKVKCCSHKESIYI